MRNTVTDATGRTGARAAAALLATIAAILIALNPVVAQTARQDSATLPDAEWTAIKTIIVEQRTALKSGDGDTAFAFASPGIRAQFGTPANFLRMVRESYAALVTARYTEFLEGAVIEGVVIQPLRLIAPDDTVLVALYTMERQRDGRWRIAGCTLAPSTVRAA